MDKLDELAKYSHNICLKTDEKSKVSKKLTKADKAFSDLEILLGEAYDFAMEK